MSASILTKGQVIAARNAIGNLIREACVPEEQYHALLKANDALVRLIRSHEALAALSAPPSPRRSRRGCSQTMASS